MKRLALLLFFSTLPFTLMANQNLDNYIEKVKSGEYVNVPVHLAKDVIVGSGILSSAEMKQVLSRTKKTLRNITYNPAVSYDDRDLNECLEKYNQKDYCTFMARHESQYDSIGDMGDIFFYRLYSAGNFHLAKATITKIVKCMAGKKSSCKNLENISVTVRGTTRFFDFNIDSVFATKEENSSFFQSKRLGKRAWCGLDLR